MNLKTATLLATVGASLAVLIGAINMVARYVPSLAKAVHFGNGVVINAIWIAISATYLIFFATLHRKQK